MDLGLEHEALRVHQDVALSSLDLLDSVVTSDFAAYGGGLDRPGIHHARAGLRIPPQENPKALADGPVDPLPGTVDAPSPEVVVVEGGPSLGKSCGSRRH